MLPSSMGTARSLVTNEQVAKDLGLTHSMVSRIRSGDRVPSMSKMAEIVDLLDWSLQDQWTARSTDKYAEGFEERLVGRYGVSGLHAED